MSWRGIRAFRLVTRDADRLTRFYAALGFAAATECAIPAGEMAVLGVPGRGWRRSLALGAARVDLDRFEAAGAPYPGDVDGPSGLFQHLALVTDDVARWWTAAREAGATAIGRAEPVILPARSGGVTALKFRDPEGHPLELIRFPDAAAGGWAGQGMLGIDHSAISVADAAVAHAFYRAQGLVEGPGTLNHGPAQAALDGLDAPVVEVLPMNPAMRPPHLELLCYRAPPARRVSPWAANDVVATRIVWAADRDALVRDPDGHLHQLVAADD